MIRGRPLNRNRILGTGAPECASGKRPYRSEAEALHAVGGGAGGIAVYRCPACHHWHHASHPRAVRRAVLGNRRTGGKMTRDR